MKIFEKKKKSKPDQKTEFYCTHCHSRFKFPLQTINLAREEVHYTCPDCKKSMATRKFDWERQTLLIQETWGSVKPKEKIKDYQESVKLTEPNQPKSEPDSFKCSICEEPFRSPVEVRYHMERSHQQKKDDVPLEPEEPEEPKSKIDDVYSPNTPLPEEEKVDLFEDIVKNPDEEEDAL